jgi:hypothetical protein
MSSGTIILEFRTVIEESKKLLALKPRRDSMRHKEFYLLEETLGYLQNLIPTYFRVDLSFIDNASEVYLDIDQNIAEFIITDIRRDFTKPNDNLVSHIHIHRYSIIEVDAVKKLYIKFVYTD